MKTALIATALLAVTVAAAPLRKPALAKMRSMVKGTNTTAAAPANPW